VLVKLSEVTERAVFKVRVDIGHLRTPPTEKPEDAYVVLREPTYGELVGLADSGGEALKNAEATSALLPALIIGHGFEVSDGVKATPVQVSDVIRSSSTLFAHVIKTWQEALPLAKKSPAS
jgi:hypothetical protein